MNKSKENSCLLLIDSENRLGSYMRMTTLRRFVNAIFSILLWSGVILFVYLLRGEDLIPEFLRDKTNLPAYGTSDYYESIGVHALILGFLLGGSFELTELNTKKASFLRRKPFLFVMLVKVLVMSLLFTFLLYVTDVIIAIVMPYTEVSEVTEMFITLLFTRDFYTHLIYFLISACIIFLFRKLHDRLGPWTLWNILSGKYAHPKEEERIFMFLDLKNSTQHAENLGHVRYSRLLQDCFNDIAESILLYEAEVYQYVGDEIVLSWNKQKGLNGCRFLGLFIHYRMLLESKAPYYLKEYGTVPEFKAGINAGPVTAVEVGAIKRELAYHGEVLNIAARLRSLCSEANRDVLISENLASEMTVPLDFLFKKQLRGKSAEMKVYAPDLQEGTGRFLSRCSGFIKAM